MGRFLNVGIIQMPVSREVEENLTHIEESIDAMMRGYHKPELIVGVEGIAGGRPETILGPMTEIFSAIAKKHHIYLIPGTISEKSDELPEGIVYNSAPIFNPEGELLNVYRKMAPWRPVERRTMPGKEYVVFDIPEKETKIGVQICYDMNFPEISRNEALMGAEVLVKLTMDPDELFKINKPLHFARALENQAYFVSTNAVGMYGGNHMYGNSMVVGPEGNTIWEAGATASVATITLDLDVVTRCRQYGTLFMDHYLQHLKEFAFPMPFAENWHKAPLFKSLEAAPANIAEYERQVLAAGVGNITAENGF